ncbi:large ribosomal subunit protein mL63 isoform 1-T1 [Liasis olivaceus]
MREKLALVSPQDCENSRPRSPASDEPRKATCALDNGCLPSRRFEFPGTAGADWSVRVCPPSSRSPVIQRSRERRDLTFDVQSGRFGSPVWLELDRSWGEGRVGAWHVSDSSTVSKQNSWETMDW